jgi:hypothetical protein
MNRLNTLNIHLGNKRNHLLIALNVVLVVFIILEIFLLNSIKPNIGYVEALPDTNTDTTPGSMTGTKKPNREGKGFK